MPVGPKLAAQLSKRYPPNERHDTTFGRYDITFVTNADGDPVILFIGQRNPDGTIRGERYSRKLVRDPATNALVKDHWDLKGKTAGG